MSNADRITEALECVRKSNRFVAAMQQTKTPVPLSLLQRQLSTLSVELSVAAGHLAAVVDGGVS